MLELRDAALRGLAFGVALGWMSTMGLMTSIYCALTPSRNAGSNLLAMDGSTRRGALGVMPHALVPLLGTHRMLGRDSASQGSCDFFRERDQRLGRHCSKLGSLSGQRRTGLHGPWTPELLRICGHRGCPEEILPGLLESLMFVATPLLVLPAGLKSGCWVTNEKGLAAITLPALKLA